MSAQIVINTRLHSLASRLAREASAAGFTSITVTAAPLDNQPNTAPANIGLVMPPQKSALAFAGKSVRIETDSTPAVLQTVGPPEEYAFRHVCEVVFDKGFNTILVVRGKWPPESDVKLCRLLMSERSNRLFQLEPDPEEDSESAKVKQPQAKRRNKLI